MRSTGDAVNEIHRLEELSDRDLWINHLHPLVKLMLTIYYMILVVSFSTYSLAGLMPMAVYPIIIYVLGNVSFLDSIRRLRFVLPIVCITGILNPFFDHTPIGKFDTFVITGGMLSMLTLMIKGVLTVFSAYLLIATTSIQKICTALRMLHIPKLLVTIILLIYRYLVLLLDEIGHTTQAYTLRAPGQKGIQFRAWGSFAGLILLRTMDRAQNIYESMCLRGFQGEFPYSKADRFKLTDIFYLILWTIILTLLRSFPLLELIGKYIGIT